MIQASDLKAGVTFELSGKPYKVFKYTHTKIGRGGAKVKVSVRNLNTGNLKDLTFGSDEKIDEISTVKKPMQYLYKDDKTATFMSPKTYEQTEIPLSLIENEINYIKEGEEINVLFWEEKALSVEIPPKVKLSVTDTPPGVKGDSATNMYKPATLENGIDIKVPLFIKPGDLIVVDTRTGEYVQRA